MSHKPLFEIIDGTKKCATCLLVKPATMFTKARNIKSGYSAYCNECTTERTKSFQRNNADKLRGKRSEFNKSEPRKAWFKEYRKKKVEEKAGRSKPDCCEICGINCDTVYDHNHSTGKFRGWLCNGCNTSIGMVKEKIAVLHKMIEYLIERN